LRNYTNAHYYGANPNAPFDAAVVIVGPKNEEAVKPFLGNKYVKRQYKLIWWPLEGYKDLTLERVLNYFRDPQQRMDLWNTWFFHRYRENTSQWPYVHLFSFYVRKDIATVVWNYSGTIPQQPAPEDEYTKKFVQLNATRGFGMAGKGNGQFEFPRNVAIDAQGNIYVADSDNHRIQKFDPDGNFVAWVGKCTGGVNCDLVNQRSMGFSCTAATCSGGGPGSNPGQFNGPHGITIKNGKLYVADRQNHRIQVLDLVTGILEYPPFGTQGSGDGQFEAPYDVAVNSLGLIYVADSGNDRIQILRETIEGGDEGDTIPSCNPLTDPNHCIDPNETVHVPPTPGGGGIGGTSEQLVLSFLAKFGSFGTTNGKFRNPHGIAVDSSNNVYVADRGNDRIQKFGLGGNFLAKFGTTGTGEGEFSEPTDVIIHSSSGNISVADYTNNRIQEFDSSRTFLRTFGVGVLDSTDAFQICTASCQAGVTSTLESAVNKPLQLAEGSTKVSTETCQVVVIAQIAQASLGSGCGIDFDDDVETCGDGFAISFLEEECDAGSANGTSSSCCSSTCEFKSSSTTCRASADSCDVAESCTGTSASCPSDSFKSAATVCRTSAGSCDIAESCTGSSASCPTDSFVSAATVCRSSSGICDLAESCTGSSALCPTDTFASAGTSCGGSDTGCDALDTCNGSGTCVDNVDSAATVCRSAAGACDVAESCDGSSKTCPADGFASAATVCRAADGECDVAESCTGSSASCPGDTFASAATVCRAADGECDVAESCTGSTASCPTDAKSSAQCRAANGECDVAESCDGVNNDCPTDVVASAATVCRAANGECDTAESCDGSSIACPTDAVAAAGTSCRAANGECDVAESCDGSATTCPVDGFATAATTCRAAAGDCDIAEACTGSSAECPTDAKSTAVCRAADGACDVAESCDGSDANCPADGFAAADTLCRASDDECGAAEYCTGTDAACPTDLASADGTLCTDTDGEDCTLAACADGQCAQVYETCLEVCRPSPFWAWHAGTEKQGTDITFAVMRSAVHAQLVVCGETLDDTDKNSASSAVEALCLPTPKEGEISQLQLAKQLTAAKLNCLANGEEPECLSLISACDTICQTPGASVASLAACIQDLELLNEGLSLYAPECEQGVLLGGTSVSPAGSTKKCADANKTSCTMTGTGETSCKAGTNNPD
jgi:DNA-binding beta-propeller fold protein YncE